MRCWAIRRSRTSPATIRSTCRRTTGAFRSLTSFGGSGDSGSCTPRLDYYGQSEICTGIRTNVTPINIDTTEAQACSQAYELLNARIEWASPEDTWRIALGATNLTDEEYFYNKFDLTAFGQPTLEGQPGPPQEWYVQFTRNFN